MSRLIKGFSLVEIMVALVVGMISMVVVMQVYSVSEGKKRTTTGGADAQTNGAIALYMIERDARMGGWGLDSSLYSGCNVTYSYCDGSAVCGGATGPLSNFSFASVRVTDGGTGNPDTITVQYFADPDLDTFRLPANTTLRSTMPQPSSELNVQSVSGCAVGSLVLVQQSGNCTLMKITQVQGTSLKLQHNPGANGEYNPSAAYQNANGWPAYSQGARLSCYASAPNSASFYKTYSVCDSNLTPPTGTKRCAAPGSGNPVRQLGVSDNTLTPVLTNNPMVSDIIDLQAQYGIASSGVAPPANQVVDTWSDATGTWADTTTTPTMTDLKKIKAVRLALLARSGQYEKPDAAGVCTTTTATRLTQMLADAGATWATFNSANYPADWQCYRYKVFVTTVPLRNILWAKI